MGEITQTVSKWQTFKMYKQQNILNSYIHMKLKPKNKILQETKTIFIFSACLYDQQ